jgi:PPOX class probable F420-dependent enzyme
MAASERAILQMNAQEVAAFIAAGRRAYLTTNGPDGWPHVVPMSYFVDEGDMMFWTDPASRKVRNLRDDNRMTCLVESGEQFDEFRAVQLSGRGEIIEDYEQSVAAGVQLFLRYAGGPLNSDQETYAGVLAHQRVVLRFRPERIMSWDHSKAEVDARTIGS